MKKNKDAMTMTTRLVSLQEMSHKIGDSEDTLKMALEVGKIGVWSWNLVNQSLSWDAQMHVLLGTNSSVFTGKISFFFDNIAKEDRSAMNNIANEAIVSGKPFEYKFKFTSPVDGIARKVTGRGRIVRDEFGEAIKMIGVCVGLCNNCPLRG